MKGNDDCIHICEYNKWRCNILKEKYCREKDCSFYKSNKEYEVTSEFYVKKKESV